MKGLSPGEIKVLFVKMRAFQAFEAHRDQLLRHHSLSLDETKLIQEIRNSCNVEIANDNSKSLSDYVEWFCSVVEATLLAKFPDHRVEIRAFAKTLRKYAERKDLASEFEAWLKQMRAAVAKYSPQLRAPRICLQFDSESGLVPPLAGRTNQDSRHARNITVLFNLPDFDPMSSASVPWVLSHEFWCHCLSDLGATKKTGCSPDATFEEGWMDWVHDCIARDGIPDIHLAPNHVRFKNHWNNYMAERRKKLSAVILRGLEVSELFQCLLVQKFSKVKNVHPIHLFRQISLDVNAWNLPQDCKGMFVDDVGWRLEAGVEERRKLAEVVRNSLGERGLCNVRRLFKLLKINAIV